MTSHGWLIRQAKNTANDVARWPEWMRRESAIQGAYETVSKYVREIETHSQSRPNNIVPAKSR